MRPIQVIGKDAPDFEDAALRACDLILARGPPNRQGAGRHGEPSGRGQGGGRRRGRKHVFVATTNSDLYNPLKTEHGVHRVKLGVSRMVQALYYRHGSILSETNEPGLR